MSSSSGAFWISEYVQKEEVDNRTDLEIYYMSADSYLSLADTYREEKKIILLYIMLMNFSSLMSETIPCHRDYLVSLKEERLSFKKKLLNAQTELETLEPTFQSLIEEQNKKCRKKVAKSDQVQYPSNLTPVEVEMPRVVPCPKEMPSRHPIFCQNWPNNLDFTPVEVEMPRVVPCPKEMPSRHPIFCQNRPNNLDFTPVEVEMPRVVPCPKEMPSRHPIFCQNRPNNLDFTPVEVEMPRVVPCPKEMPSRHPIFCQNRPNNLDFTPVEVEMPRVVPCPKEMPSRHPIFCQNRPNNLDFTPVEVKMPSPFVPRFSWESCQKGKDVEVAEHGEFTAKDYTDPPPAPLIDVNELTQWSFYRALMAEFIATFLFLYVTVATVIGYKSEVDPTKNSAPDAACSGVVIFGIAWAFGGMIFILLYCMAGISGGHINPAVTFGLFLARKVSLIRAVLYMVAQCLGAICGVGLVKGFHKSYYDRYGGGANELAPGYNKGTGLGAEIIGTFVLVYTVFSATNPKRNARDSHVPVLAPLPIGFAVFMVHLAMIPFTGTGINPARSFGAAVIHNKDKAWDDQWIFWVGPFIGAAIAAAYHQYILRAAAIKALGSFRSNPHV